MNDLGPLAWVLDELRKSLNSGTKALKRFAWDAEAARGSDLAAIDASQLRIARQQLHQAVGALEMVGLAGPVLMLRAMEAAVQKFVQQPEHCNQDAVAKIEYASFALTEYLEGVLADRPVSAVSLFPQYRDVQELVRAERIHPADLWSLEWRWIEPQLSVKPAPRPYSVEIRAAMDQAVLQIMKGGAPKAARAMGIISLGFSAQQTDRRLKIFWIIAAGYFEAVAHDLLNSDLYVRRLASRVLMQYASLAKGDTAVSERLAHDLLFFCAQATPSQATDIPALSAVRVAYGLARFKPINYLLIQFGRFDPALLAQARKRIVSAKEAWTSLCGGDASKAKTVAEQFALVTDSLLKLHPPSEQFAQVLTRAIDTTVHSGQIPGLELAMEVATSVLYLEAVFEDLDPNDPQLAVRTASLAQRLEKVRAGGAPQPLESWMEELYSRVSDKQTMGSVVGELRVSLGELEKLLDAFFRNTKDKAILQAVPGQLSQMRGVLSVLGLDQACKAVLRMKTSVQKMIDTEVNEQRARAEGTFENLGNNLGALSFLIDMLNYQPALAKKLFIYDEEKGELKPVMGRASNAADAVAVPPVVSDPLPPPVPEIKPVPPVVVPPPVPEVKPVPPVVVPPPVPEVKPVPPVVVPPPVPEVKLVPPVVVPPPVPAVKPVPPVVVPPPVVVTPAPVVRPPPPPPPAPVACDDDDDDFDLRDIFLEEAREVIGNATQAIDALGHNPADLENLTILRRAFHTLKGSSRMVGLNEFGEAGWSLEQMLNSWLADQKSAHKEFRVLCSEAIAGFQAWVDAIASDEDASWSAVPFRNSAEAMRLNGLYLALDLSAPASDVAGIPPVIEPVVERTAPEIVEPSPVIHVQPVVIEVPPVVVEKPVAIEVPPAVVEKPVVIEVPPAVVEKPVVIEVPPVVVEKPIAIEVPPAVVEKPIAIEVPPVVVEKPVVIEVPPAVALPTDTLVSELTNVDFDSFFSLDEKERKLQEPQPVVPEIAPEEPALPELELSLDDFAHEFQVKTPADLPVVSIEQPVLVQKEPAPVLVPVVAPAQQKVEAASDQVAPHEAEEDEEDENVTVIDSLRIGTALYNVYLGEADQWSIRLLKEVTDWAAEGHHMVNASTVGLAHALSGSSATVGFHGLSEIARALEYALQNSRDHGNEDVVAYGQVFIEAATEIRRLLHQFAAGFLKEPQADLLERLKHLEFPDSGAPKMNDSERYGIFDDLDDVDNFEMAFDEVSEQLAVVPEEAIEPMSVPVSVLVPEEISIEALTQPEPEPKLETDLKLELDSLDLDSLGLDSLGLGSKFESNFESNLETDFETNFEFELEPEPETKLPPAVVAVSTVLPTDLPTEVSSTQVAPAVSTQINSALITPLPSVPTPVAVPPVSVKSLDHPGIDDDIDAVDAIDPDLFPIFEEECAELMPRLSGALRQWAEQPDNQTARIQVLRALHTLKGSARLAGALRLGEMAHRIESEIEHVGSDAAQSQEFEPLLARLDGVQATFDALRRMDVAEEEPSQIVPVPRPLFVQPDPEPQPVLHQNKSTATTATATATVTDEQPVLPVVVETVESVRKSLIPAPQPMVMQAVRQASTASIRVRSQLLDRMVNQAGEVMITRSRLEAEVGQLRDSMNDMNVNLTRLRQQLRDIELQAESQMQSRLALAKEAQAGFDPLEFDRFTRVQELTRMMAESVNDVATVQRTLQRTIEATEDDLIAQGRQTRELQRDLLRTRMVEFESISERLYRVVRQTSKELGKQVRLDLLGGTLEMDRGMLDRMVPAFEHLLRNCVTHGIETPEARIQAGKESAGLITIHLRQEGNDVSVEFSDDGAGLNLARIRELAVRRGLIAPDQPLDDAAAANLIFLAGFSTATQVTEIAGRGIGMEVVRSEVNALGGRIETSTVAGKGSNFKLVLPLTTAVTQVVMIRADKLSVGVPTNVVEVVRRISIKELQQAYNAGTLDVAGEAVPFFWAGALLQASRHSSEAQAKSTPVVVFRSASQRIALHVDEVLGNREVVVKNLGPQLSRLPGMAGMSVLPSGAVVLIYNPVALAAVYGEQARAWSSDRAEPHMLGSSKVVVDGVVPPSVATPATPKIPLILVVDDSITVRRVTQRLLLRDGYRVALAADGLQALDRLRDELPAVVLSDIEMPRMDGFELARNIRGDERLKALPIIMITSRIASKHHERAKDIGVDHYLGKPYSEDELMKLVRHYCTLAAGNAPASV